MSQFRRVAITGIGVTTPLGSTPDSLMDNLREGKSAVRAKPELAKYSLKSLVSSEIPDFDERSIPRNLRRSMSRVSLLAVDATGKALRQSDLPREMVENIRTGVSFGSTMGGTSTIERYYSAYADSKNFEGLLTSSFLQIMSHTAAANVALAYGIPGRVIASCVACASSTQAIGFGYEAIKFGKADRMICGGAEEYHGSISVVFDLMQAASRAFNETPTLTPRPFSADRDGIVVGEGAGTVILEAWEHAKARNAPILGEVVGFFTNSDSQHLTNPSIEGMCGVMQGALDDAGVSREDISYINAHGSGTRVGDSAESRAIARLFGDGVPVSSLKGHLGHLMGACGVVETIASLLMMRDGCIVPTLHLQNVDPECAGPDHVMGDARSGDVRLVLKNSFAFGGINASLVLKKV